jgi:hypothetical protein
LKNIQGEQWEDIPGFEDEYQLSNYGRLKSQDRFVNYGRCDCFRPGRIKKLHSKGSKKEKDDNLNMQLHKDGKRYRFSVARHVYNLFVAPFDIEDHSVVITRKDGDILNCHYQNLELRSLSSIAKEGFALNKRRSVFQLQIKQVTQYHANGQKIATYRSTKQASAASGITANYINDAARTRNRMAGGFYWRYGKPISRIKVNNLKNRNGLTFKNTENPELHYLNRSLKNIPGEKWKAVQDYNGLYEISDHGRVRSLRRLQELTTKKGNHTQYWKQEFIMKQSLRRAYNHLLNEPLLYLCISLKKKDIYSTYTVSRLVYDAFGKNITALNDKRIIHADGDNLNNHISNLRPVTQTEILKTSFKNKRRVSHFANLPAKQRGKYTLKAIEAMKQPVIQCNLQGKYIGFFNSLAEAGKAIGISDTTISSALNGRYHTAGGFIWKRGIKKKNTKLSNIR